MSLSRLLLSLALILISLPAWSEIPYTFTPGQAANAQEVNANFTALQNQINQLQSQIAVLSGNQTSVTVAGTYDIFRLGVDVDSFGNGGFGVAGSSFSGTATLNADGTGSFSTTENYRQLNISTSTTNNQAVGQLETTYINLNVNPEIGSGSLTWILSGNTVTITPTDDNPVSLIMNGKIAVGIEYSEGNSSIYIFLKR